MQGDGNIGNQSQSGPSGPSYTGVIWPDWEPLTVQELRQGGYSISPISTPGIINNSNNNNNTNNMSNIRRRLRNASGLRESQENIFRSETLVNGRAVITCLVADCGYQSDKNSNFKRHFETMHYLLDPPIECCGLRFLTKWEFRHHSKSVHYEGHRCSQCLKLFNRKALLERHMAIHTGAKPFGCSKCEYASANKANVTRHLSIHPGDAWVEVHQSQSQIEEIQNQFSITKSPHNGILDDSTSVSSSFHDSSSDRIAYSSSPGWRDSSFSSTRTSVSSPCSTPRANDNDDNLEVEADNSNTSKQSYSFEDLIVISSSKIKRGRISHSIDSILGKTKAKKQEDCIKADSYQFQRTTTSTPTLPQAQAEEDEARRKSGEGNWARINEDGRPNWSHLSPQSQNPSTSTTATASFRPFLASSVPAAGQAFFCPGYEEMMRRPSGNVMTGPPQSQPYFNTPYVDGTVVSQLGNQGPEQGSGASLNLNQDSRFGQVPGFFPALCHQAQSSFNPYSNNSSNRSNTFVSNHVFPAHAGGRQEGAENENGSGNCCKTEKVENNNWNNSLRKRAKRVHEELSFVNESPPVPFVGPPPPPPQEFVNEMGMDGKNLKIEEVEVRIKVEVDGNGIDEYIPKKLRLAKKYENLSS